MNWMVDAIKASLEAWGKNQNAVIDLLTQTPEAFRGGGIWKIVLEIINTMQLIAYPLIILFFLIGYFQVTSRLTELRHPATALKVFIRLTLTKFAVDNTIMLLKLIISTVFGIANKLGKVEAVSAGDMPAELVTKMEQVDFFGSIPLWFLSLIFYLFVFVVGAIILIHAYNRFFKIFLFMAFAPISLATFAGRSTSIHGRNFLQNFIGLTFEGAIIILGFIIFKAYVNAPPPAGLPESAFVATAQFMTRTAIDMLVLVGLVKGSSGLTKQIFGL